MQARFLITVDQGRHVPPQEIEDMQRDSLGFGHRILDGRRRTERVRIILLEIRSLRRQAFDLLAYGYRIAYDELKGGFRRFDDQRQPILFSQIENPGIP